MKNASLIINIALLVAVGVLSSCNSDKGSAGSSAGTSSAITGDLRVAYFITDSIVDNYDFLKDRKVELEAKSKKLDQDLRNRAEGFQNEVAAYQRNVSSMTLGQVKATEEDLGKKQQNLQMYEQTLNQQLMEEQAKLQKEIYDRLTAYSKKYGQEQGIHIILKRDQSSDVMWATDALDISKEMIKGLNEEYTAEKNGTSTKADSTAAK